MGVTHLMMMGTQEMLGIFEVKGEATLASVSDREIPAWAVFRACRRGRGGRGGGAVMDMCCGIPHPTATHPTVIGSITTHGHTIAV